MALSTVGRAASPILSSPAEKRAFRRALQLFKEVAQRVPAYKDFLKKAKVNPKNIETPSDFAQIPTVDKPNYISNYSLEELSWDGELSAAKYISSSSGSTGVPFYWPRGTPQDIAVARLYQRIYENIFDTKRGRTLSVNLFALGTWIAGLEFYNATKWVADLGNRIVIITPGIEKAVAGDAIIRLAPSFDRIVLAGYPPFIKDVLEFGIARGLDWKKWDIRLLGAGEAFSEVWRDRVSRMIGKRDSLSSFVNVYGMAESGVVAHETPLSIFARKRALQLPNLASILVHDGQISPLYQYDPMTRFFEVEAEDSLILTSDAGLPIVRYNTRDRGGILSHAAMIKFLRDASSAREVHGIDPDSWSSPFVYLFGRKDLSISFYALNIYVENIKQALESTSLASSLSGLFTMSVGHTRGLDQRFEIMIELSRESEPTAALTKNLTKHIVAVLCKVNSEYSKLYTTIGKKAVPKVALVHHGKIHTVPGRKHKWVTRT